MITLEPMTEAEYQSFLEPAIIEYAEGHVTAGQWTEDEAVEQSRKEFHDLLPNGVATPNHYLFTIVNEEKQKVGMIWFMLREKPDHREAFIYDVRIDDAFRRRGYGSQAFLEIEKRVQALGGNKIALHVFGNNHAARDMYEKLGYETTNVIMAKTLDPQ